MPEDPKTLLHQMRAAKAAERRARETAKEAQKRRDREAITREELELSDDDPLPIETDQAVWVAENMEWESSLRFWEPPNCSYSDYSGSFVDKANMLALLREFPAIFTKDNGAHGWEACGIREEKRLALTEEEYEAIKDIIEGLEDYPVVDEDLLSDIELEAKSDFWGEYGRSAVRSALIEKFDGYPDVQIAVVLRPNAYWDSMYQNHEWDQYIEEETGCNFYFREKNAVEDVEADEIVNEEEIAAFKKKLFFEEYADKLGELLESKGIDYTGAEQLWSFVEYVDSVSEYALWEVDGHVPDTKDELDPADMVSLDVEVVADAIDQPEFMRKQLHHHWATDPRQLKLPGFESKALALVNALLEAEDPKEFLLKQAPAGIPRRYVGNMPKEIEICGRRWFSRTYGNTYFTAKIYVDGQLVHTMPEEYGYGDHYLWQSFEWLEKNGYVPYRPRNASNMADPPRIWCEKHGIRLNYHAEDIRRRRDRFTESEDPVSVLRNAGQREIETKKL